MVSIQKKPPKELELVIYIYWKGLGLELLLLEYDNPKWSYSGVIVEVLMKM